MTTITRTHRWTRLPDTMGNWDWVEIECFKLVDPDGRVGYADFLGPEQSIEFRQQEAQRATQARLWAEMIEPLSALSAAM